MKTIRLILLILFITFMVSTILVGFFLHSEPTKEKVDCFDKYGNKILNQVCEETHITMPTLFWVFVVLTIITEAIWVDWRS